MHNIFFKNMALRSHFTGNTPKGVVDVSAVAWTKNNVEIFEIGIFNLEDFTFVSSSHTLSAQTDWRESECRHDGVNFNRRLLTL